MSKLTDAEIWDANAAVWDAKMGEGNDFYRFLIKPKTEQLLALDTRDIVLDIACGNGQFAREISSRIQEIWAFDFSGKLIEIAEEKTRKKGIKNISYQVLDATLDSDLNKIPSDHFTAAVCNMSLMDISDLKPLSRAVARVLKANGRFVFSLCHPCFNQPRTRFVQELQDNGGHLDTVNSIKISEYLTPKKAQVLAFAQETTTHSYYHRSISDVLRPFLEEGFLVSGVEETSFPTDQEINAFPWSRYHDIPPVLICRLTKNKLC